MVKCALTHCWNGNDMERLAVVNLMPDYYQSDGSAAAKLTDTRRHMNQKLRAQQLAVRDARIRLQ